MDGDLGARVVASEDVELQLVPVLQLEAEAGALLFQTAPVEDGIAVCLYFLSFPFFLFLPVFVFLYLSTCVCVCNSVSGSLSTYEEWQSCRTRSPPRPCSASTPGWCGPACAAAPGPKCIFIGKHLQSQRRIPVTGYIGFGTSWQLDRPHLLVRRGRPLDCSQKMQEPLTNADAIPTRHLQSSITKCQNKRIA